jgi:hypothetical protein
LHEFRIVVEQNFYDVLTEDSVTNSSNKMMRRLPAQGFCLRVRYISVTPSLRQQGQGRNEDKEELEREEQLRRQFQDAQTQQQPGGLFGGLSSIMQQAQQKAQQGGTGNKFGQPQGYPSSSGQMPSANALNIARAFQYLLISVGVYAVFMVYLLNKEGSNLNVLQGIPMHALPAESAATYVLLRILAPFKLQAQIRKEFESANQIDPCMTLPQFVMSRYPAIFQGHKTSFPELLAAMSACSASSGNAYVTTVQRTINRVGNKDVQGGVDAIMEALRIDFPAVFSPGITPSQSSLNDMYQQQDFQGQSNSLSVPHSGTIVRFSPSQEPYFSTNTHQAPNFTFGEETKPSDASSGGCSF